LQDTAWLSDYGSQVIEFPGSFMSQELPIEKSNAFILPGFVGSARQPTGA
jgi:hypothetical protein